MGCRCMRRTVGQAAIASVGRSWRGMSAAELVAAAAAVRARAYAPYSGFAVGAAIRGARRRRLRRLQRRERGLSAGPVRRGQRRSASWWPPASGRSPRSRWSAAARAVHALRRLPPAPGRVRPARDAGPSGRARGAARDHDAWARCCPWRSGRSTLAAPRQRRLTMPPRSSAAAPAALQPLVAIVLGSGLGGIAERIIGAGRDRPTPTCRAFRARACRAMPGGWCSAAWPACRSPACQGRAHLYEGVGAAAAQHARAHAEGDRLPGAAADQRLGLAAARARRGLAGADRGPHQPAGHQPAARGRTTTPWARASSI